MTKRFVALLGATVIVLAACQPGTPSTPPAATTLPGQSPAASTPTTGGLAAEQILNIWCCAEDPRSLEAAGASGSDEISILGGTNRGLLHFNADLSLKPELAEALPEISADGLTYTYTLKEGLKYSNGDPILAEDFVRAAQHLADPRNAFDYGYEMCWVKGADAVMGADFGCSGDTPYLDADAGTFDDAQIDGLLDGLGVTAPDERTVVYELKQPVSFWPNITAMWLLTPVPAAATSYSEASDLIASGPFMISEWTHNSELVLVPNPNWTGTKPTLTEIHIFMGGDPEAAMASYETGDYDMVVVPSTSTARVAEDPVLKEEISDAPQLLISYFDFATCQAKDSAGEVLCPPNSALAGGTSPSANKNFRIALTRAVDKQELIDQTYGGLGSVANGSVMPGIPGWPDDYNPHSFDVAAAKASMTTAMDELGVTSDPVALGLPADPAPTAEDIYLARVHSLGRLKFGYNCNAGHEPRVFYLYDAWQTNLGFNGQQFDISCTDFGTFRTERRAGNIYDIARNAWGADFPHPDNQLRDLFACGAGNNNSKWCNPAFDDLLNKGAAESDPETSNGYYVEAQRLLVDEAPVMFFTYGVVRSLIKPYVTGLTTTANDHQNAGDVFYETIQILER